MAMMLLVRNVILIRNKIQNDAIIPFLIHDLRHRLTQSSSSASNKLIYDSVLPGTRSLFQKLNCEDNFKILSDMLEQREWLSFPTMFRSACGWIRILLDCPLDLSALTIFSPIPAAFVPLLQEELSNYSHQDSLDMEVETQIKIPVDARSLIHTEPWYKTAKNLHLWDPSSFDIVLFSSTIGMIGLPFLTQSKGFSAKIYATEATVRLGKLMIEDLVSMHKEFRQFYGSGKSNSPQWMKWEELELLPSSMKEVVLGKDGSELGGWMPLYNLEDVKDCM